MHTSRIAVPIAAAISIVGVSFPQASAASTALTPSPGAQPAGKHDVARYGLLKPHPFGLNGGAVAWWNVGSTPDQICNTNGKCWTVKSGDGVGIYVQGANTLGLNTSEMCLVAATSGYGSAGAWESFALDASGNISSEVSDIRETRGNPISIAVGSNEAVGQAYVIHNENNIIQGFTLSPNCVLTETNSDISAGLAAGGVLLSPTAYASSDGAYNGGVYVYKVKTGVLGSKPKLHHTQVTDVGQVASTGAGKQMEIFTGDDNFPNVPSAQAMTSRFKGVPGSPQVDGNSGACGGAAVAVDAAHNQLYQAEYDSCGTANEIASYSISPFKYESGTTGQYYCGAVVVAGSGSSAGTIGVDGVLDIAFGSEGGSGASGFTEVASTQYSSGLVFSTRTFDTAGSSGNPPTARAVRKSFHAARPDSVCP